MPNTVAQYEAYAAAHPRRPDGSAWADGSNSWCVSLVYECGGFTGASFDNASQAANYALQHHGLDPDWSTAQPGEFDYWVTGAGHIAMRSAKHAGWDLMASNFVPAVDHLGPGMGYQTPTAYGIPVGHGHQYVGHSPYFRDATLTATLDPSGGGGTPVNPIGDEMRLMGPYGTPATYLLEAPNGIYSLPNQAAADSFYRYINTVTPAAADASYVASTLAAKPSWPFWEAPASSGATVDVNALAAALAPLLPTLTTQEIADTIQPLITTSQTAIISKIPTKVTLPAGSLS